ncbi:hypothetical protein F0250_22550 [Vibrio cyclitrophicus]|nr:hypothetical protein [Vibrio cyclitrophicus]NOI36666.1 hypothetical protein [Vibrio cyclitrophicus]
MFESDFIQDWLDSKKELAPISVASIDDHQHRQQVTRDAKKRNKNSEKMTFADKTKNVRQHRKDELAATTNVLTSESNNSALIEVSEAPLTGSKVIPLPKGRKRRTKGGKS